MEKRSFFFRSMLAALTICFAVSRLGAFPVIKDTTTIDQLYNLAKSHYHSNPDSARFYLQKVESLSKQLGYERGTAYALYGYGITATVLYKRFEYFTQSLEIFGRLHDKFGMSINLVNIGTIYSQIGQRDKALEYFKQSLALKKELADYGGIALALISIGKMEQIQGQVGSALQYFREAHFYRIKNGNRQGIAYAQVNMGEAFYSLHRMSEALAMADSASHNFSLTADNTGLIWSLYIKGKSLAALGREKEAEMIFEQVCHYPSRPDFLGLVNNAKGELIRIYSGRGDIQRAFHLQSEYLVAKDTLAKQDYRAETLRLANEYEFRMAEQKEQQEKAMLDLRTARRYNLENLSIAIIVLLLFVILVSARKVFASRIVDGFLMLVFLLFFEFLLVLTDSSVEKITGGEPILKLLANVILALFILPGHQFLERYTRKRLLATTADQV